MGKLKRHNIFPFSFEHNLGAYLNRFIPRQKDTGNADYIPYGKDNKLPQEILELIGNNGTAMRAMRMRSKYIYADGFSANFDLPANKKQSVNQLLSEVTPTVAMMQGFCLQVLRNGAGEVAEVHYLPLEWVRKHPDGGFSVNKTLGTNKESKEWERHPVFLGRDVTPEQIVKMKQEYGNKSEIAYFYQKDAISFDYAVPDWFASEFDIRTGTELMLLDNEMVTNGFMPSAIITFPGNIDDTTEDDDGKTAADYRDDVIKGFTGNSRSTETGKSGRMRIAIFDVGSKEEAPIIDTVAIEKIISGSIEKRDDIDRRICRLFGVRPILLGFEEASILGNQQALANASMQLAMDVVGEQQLICEGFKDVFGIEFNISRFTPLNYIPDKILEDLTQSERREMVGYSPIVEPVNPSPDGSTS